jgi:hypothetical protein
MEMALKSFGRWLSRRPMTRLRSMLPPPEEEKEVKSESARRDLPTPGAAVAQLLHGV